MSNAKAQIRRPPARRRGSVYIAVLGASLMVVTLAIGGILATRVQARGTDTNNDAAEARAYAQSGLELARLWISQDSSWRTKQGSAPWNTSVAIGSGSFTVSLADQVDGVIADRPHDAVIVTSTGRKGQARQVLQQTLSASPVALPALRYALFTGGQLHVRASARMILGPATIATNGSLRNDNVIEGNVDAGSYTAAGTIYGTLTSGVTARAMPSSTVPEAYANLGSSVVTSNTIDKEVLGPGRNPFGTANSDGVYVIRTSSNLTIRNCRIYGTLVVICPGKEVTIDSSTFIQPVRADYPALIINGDAKFNFDSTGSLSEAAVGANFNPTGAAYLNTTDTDTSDTYPCRIDGLVHVTGKLSVQKPCVIRGAVICESTAGTDAADINTATFQVNYDSTLYTSPPQFYTTSVPMRSLAGSYKPVTQ